VTATATVTATHGDGRLVDVELVAVNNRGEAARGVAQVALPG